MDESGPVLGELLGWQKWYTLKTHYEQCWDEWEDMGYGSLKEGGDMIQNWNWTGWRFRQASQRR